MIFGIDYAVVNEIVKDYTKLKPFLDFQFAFYRLTQGYNIYDNVYVIKGEAQKAHDVDMLTSGWHQFDPTQSTIIQMDNFCRSWDAVKDLDLRPILAVESGAIIAWASVPAKVQADMLEQCCEILKTRIADPIIYSREEYWDTHVEQRSRWGTLPIWLAHYIPKNLKQAPTLLAPPSIGRLRDWPNYDKWLWQYTDKGIFPGIVVSPKDDNVNANIDLNAFNGTREELNALKMVTPEPAPEHSHDEIYSKISELDGKFSALHNGFVSEIVTRVSKLEGKIKKSAETLLE